MADSITITMTINDALRHFKEAGLDELDGVSGVYILAVGKRSPYTVHYVGISNNIRRRLKKHHIYNPNFHDAIYVFPLSDRESMKRLELALIHYFRPEGNQTGVWGCDEGGKRDRMFERRLKELEMRSYS